MNLQLKNVVENLLQTKEVRSEECTANLKGPSGDVKEPVADASDASQSNYLIVRSTQTPLGKRKAVEEKEQRDKEVRLNLMQALSNPTVLSKKQTLRKSLGADLYKERTGSPVQSGKKGAAAAAQPELEQVVKAEHDIPNESSLQDEDLPGSNSEPSDSAVRHYKRRRRGEQPLLSENSGSKRSCELVSASEASDADKAGSLSEDEQSSDRKRRKVEHGQVDSPLRIQEVEVEYAGEADKGKKSEDVPIEYADDVMNASDMGTSPAEGTACSKSLVTSPRPEISKDAIDCPDGRVEKDQVAIEVSEARTLKEAPSCAHGSAMEDSNRPAPEMCTVHVEVVDLPVGLHGAIDVGVCPADEIPRPEGVHYIEEQPPQGRLASNGERNGLGGDGASCPKTPVDKFCAQIQTLARQEVITFNMQLHDASTSPVDQVLFPSKPIVFCWLFSLRERRSRSGGFWQGVCGTSEGVGQLVEQWQDWPKILLQV